MAAGDRTVKSILQWQTDQASLAKLITDSNKAGTAVALQSKRAADAATGARAATDAYNTSIGKLGASASANMAILESKFRSAVETTQRLRARNEELASSYQRVTQGANAAASASSRVSIGGSSLASGYGTIRSSAGALAQLGAGVLPNQIASLVGLTATLGPLGLAAGVAVGAASLLTSELERQAVAFKDYAASVKSQADLVASGATTLDVEKQVANLHTAEQFIAQRIDTLNQYEAKILEIDEVFHDDPEKWGAALEAVFQEVSAVTGTTITDLNGLQGSISALSADSLTYNQSVLALNRLLASGALSANDAAAALEYLTKAQEENAKRLRESEEIRSKALQTQQAQAIGLIDAEVDARERLFEVEEKIAETVREREARTAEIVAEREAQIAELTAEGGERRAEIIADSEARIAKITRDSYQTLYNLTAERDALGFKLEQQRLAKAVGDEQDAAGKALTQQKQGEAKSLASQIKNADKALAAQISSGDKSLATLYTAKRQEEFLIFNSLNAQLAITQSVTSQIVAAYAAGMNQLTVLTNSAFNGSSGNRLVGGGSQPLSLTYAGGGPSLQAQQFARQFDSRYKAYLNGSSGNRLT